MEDFLLRVREEVARFKANPETSEELRRIAANFLRDAQTVGNSEALPKARDLSAGSAVVESRPPTVRQKRKASPISTPASVNGSLQSYKLLFHEPWWLSATAGNEHVEVSTVRGEHLSGRLSFMKTRSRFGYRILRMPYFTHVLGPMIESSDGKRQRRLANRLSLIRDLLDQLPAYDLCHFVMDPSLDEGLALGDGLAFQAHGFKVSPQYAFRVHCQTSVDELWAALDFKVRQHIRRAEEKYSIVEIDDPQYFVDFYLRNIEKRGRQSYFQFDRFPHLFTECRARSCGVILAALLPDGSPAAMTFLVWGHGVLYYTLSTRVPDASESGCVNLLIWSAIRKAQALGLIFDLDGIVSQGIARFLGGYGGEISVRMVVTHAKPLYGAIKSIYGKLDPYSSERSKFLD
jgi:hypothetical protein